eukprot:TRINITY_DN3950_c0_g1_i1.p1 TRINITY_DN3950_c0_g1~~TRINITY_DN3950_c0_g1_i1.p1  ORF type:complete len:294 (-),score=90.47 TRINITY_DN3950_c0_g1_i1:562-1320(-)
MLAPGVAARTARDEILWTDASGTTVQEICKECIKFIQESSSKMKIAATSLSNFQNEIETSDFSFEEEIIENKEVPVQTQNPNEPRKIFAEKKNTPKLKFSLPKIPSFSRAKSIVSNWWWGETPEGIVQRAFSDSQVCSLSAKVLCRIISLSLSEDRFGLLKGSNSIVETISTIVQCQDNLLSCEKETAKFFSDSVASSQVAKMILSSIAPESVTIDDSLESVSDIISGLGDSLETLHFPTEVIPLVQKYLSY